MSETKQCPCNSGFYYASCCQAVLTGQAIAATAEALMRSRYSAYVAGDIDYLLRTWHPSTRPSSIDADTIPGWCGLEVIRTEKGLKVKDDDEGIVEFQATAQACHNIVKLHEASRFVKEAGQWLYVSGDITEDSPQAGNKSIKVGRNCPCPCGSGQKYKKCCGPRVSSRTDR